MKRRTFVAALATALAAPAAFAQKKRVDATLYKNPLCGCCQDHAAYLRQHGYDVKEVATHDLAVATYPGLVSVDTSNAEVNAWMNAVNDALGYRTIETLLELQKKL